MGTFLFCHVATCHPRSIMDRHIGHTEYNQTYLEESVVLKKIVLVLGVFIILILTFSFAFKETNKISTKNISETEPVNVSNQAASPVSSGPVADVPWLNDESFQKAQAQYNTPVLLAAFCTVLHDPLPGEEHNVHHAAQILAGTVVKPGKVFSMNNTIGPYKSPQGFRAGPVYCYCHPIMSGDRRCNLAKS